jgi:hypothetical protein
MKRHFTVVTVAGSREEIYCDEMDDSEPHEIWFIFKDQPPRIFRSAGIISHQEHPPSDLKAWDEFLRNNQMPEATYEPSNFEDGPDLPP